MSPSVHGGAKRVGDRWLLVIKERCLACRESRLQTLVRVKSGRTVFTCAALLLSVSFFGAFSSPQAEAQPNTHSSPLSVVGTHGKPSTKSATFEASLTAAFAEVPNGVLYAASVMSEESGERVFSLNGGRVLIPASLQKLFVTYAALKRLGSDYRFKTRFYADREAAAGEVKNLYIQGGGDPSLVEENLFRVAWELKKRGVRSVENIVVDDSLFLDTPIGAGGLDPYRAVPSAASLNFNSFAIAVYPSVVGDEAFVSLSPGAPYKLQAGVVTVEDSERGRDPLPPKISLEGGTVRVTGRIERTSPGNISYFTVPHPSRYLGAALADILQEGGIGVRGGVESGIVPAGAKLVMVLSSKDLTEILNDLNHYSNNFIAGQLVYHLGKRADGKADLARGLTVVEESLREAGIGLRDHRFVDGSGLSRENRASTDALARVLVVAANDLTVAPQFIASLSRFGKTGTVKRRRLPVVGGDGWERSEGVWAKTGSLDGVSSLAGYVASLSGQRYTFAVIFNGPIDKERASAIEERFVSTLMKRGE